MNTNSIVRGVENVRFTPNRHFGLAVCGASNVVHRGAYQLVPVLYPFHGAPDITIKNFPIAL